MALYSAENASSVLAAVPLSMIVGGSSAAADTCFNTHR